MTGRGQQVRRTRLAGAARMSSGAVRVGIGLGVFGLSSYVFLAIAARQLSPAHFAVLSTLWVLVYTGGPGVFLPFEQAIGRAAAIHRADPAGERAVVRMLVVASAVAVVALLLVSLAFHGVLVRHLFGGSESTFVALLLSLVGMWGAYVTRGVFAGHDRYTAYGVQLAVEGLARIALGVLAALVAWSLGGFALGLAAALIASVVLTMPAARGGHRRSFEVTVTDEDPGRRTQLRILGWLIVGAVGMQVLVNIGPVIAQADSGGSGGAAGHFLGALMLARLPLFAFAAVQAALLPELAHTVADGDRRGLWRSLRNLFTLIGVAMGIFTVVLALVGPQLVRVVYGAGFGLHRLDLVLLAIGTGIAMLAIVAGNAVVAVGAPAASAGAWAASVAVLVIVVVVLPGSIFMRLEVSYIVGVIAALVGQLFAVFARVRAAGRGSGDPAPRGREPAPDQHGAAGNWWDRLRHTASGGGDTLRMIQVDNWRAWLTPRRRMPLFVYAWSQLILLGWWAVNFPAQFSVDSTMYLRHVTVGPWVADHSVLYDFTILCSLKLTGSVWLISLAQTVVYAVILAIIASRIRDLGVKPMWAALPALLIVFVPTFGSFVTMLWKDVPFTAANMFLAATLLTVIADRRAGKSRLSVSTTAVLAVEMVAVCLFRNNGYVVVIVAVVILVAVLKGSRLKIAIAGVIAVVAFEGAVASYPLFGIEKASPVQAYGVFYGDIAYVYSQDPQVFTAAELTTMNEVAPLAAWRSGSNCLISDSLFYSPKFSTDAAVQNRQALMKLWFALSERSPTNLIGGHLCRASVAWRVRPTAGFGGLPVSTPSNLYGRPTIVALGKTPPLPQDLVRELRPHPVSWKLYHAASWSRGLIDHDQPYRFIFSRAPAWTYLAYLLVAVAAWRNRWKTLLVALVPIVANQLTVMAANPAQFYRYVVVQLFLSVLFLPLVGAVWPRGQQRPGVHYAANRAD